MRYLLFIIILLIFSCEMPDNESAANKIQESNFAIKTILTSETSIIFDTLKTYQYNGFEKVEPLKLLSQLERSHISVRRAWLPLDDMCLNPIGPRFTIELAKQNDKVKKFDFINGTGMLFCASMIDEYSKKEK